MEQNKKNDVIQDLKNFTECFNIFPDNVQLSYFKTFLGKIETPFNKQKLTEKLGGFFFNQENRKNIFLLLTKSDYKILSFVNFSKEPTKNDALLFFKNSELLSSDIEINFQNLVSRLLILPKQNEDSKKTFYIINPILKNSFDSVLSKKIALNQIELKTKISESAFFITPQFLAGVLCYVQQFPDLCKIDGTIKKKNLETISQIFQGSQNAFSLVLTSFLNLGLLKQGETKISVDQEKLTSFCTLSTKEQYAYLVATAKRKLSRESLKTQSKLILDFLESFLPGGQTLNLSRQTAFFIARGNKTQNEPILRRRFSLILENAKSKSESESFSYKNQESQKFTESFIFDVAEEFFQTLIDFGLLSKIGTNFNDEEVYDLGPALENLQNLHPEYKKVLNIDAGTSITILPGLILADFIKFIPFLKIVNCNFIAQFELDKKSVSQSFSNGFTVEKILATLEEYSSYQIPQSLKINLEEWHASYSGAVLYKGYVLHLNEKNRIFAESNKKLKNLIQKEIAPGVYFLNIPVNDENEDILKTLDFDFISSIQYAKNKNQSLSFESLGSAQNIFTDEEKNLFPWKETESAQNEYLNQLYAEVQKQDFSQEIKLELNYRIKSRIIINSNQIKNGTVSVEVLEATGMDYVGKVHLINSAITLKNKIELSIPSQTDSTKIEKFFGLPQFLTKAEDSAVVRITIEPENEERVFSVGRISHIKMIRCNN